MAADALAPCVTTSLAAMVLAMQDNQAFVFQVKGLQLLVPSPSWEITENANVFQCFPEQIQHKV